MDIDQSQDTNTDNKAKKLKELEEKWKIKDKEKKVVKTKKTEVEIEEKKEEEIEVEAEEKSATVAVVRPAPLMMEPDKAKEQQVKQTAFIAPTARIAPEKPVLMQSGGSGGFFKQQDKNSKQNHLLNQAQNTQINTTIN